MDNSDNTKLANIIRTNFGGQPAVEDTTSFKIALIILLIWSLFGLIAFITSIVCFTRSGSAFDKVMGLLLAIFFGPLYFLFFAFSGSYCK